MKIESNYDNYRDPLLSKKELAPQRLESKVLKKDDISLSETAQKLQRAQKSEAMEVERSVKVTALKQAVQAGTYQVSAKEIAQEMIRVMKGTED